MLEIEIWSFSMLNWLLTSPFETFNVIFLAFCVIDDESVSSAPRARVISSVIMLESSPSAALNSCVTFF
nr:MAG TPA: hypothetical protein [Caudoviricetes sp.]